MRHSWTGFFVHLWVVCSAQEKHFLLWEKCVLVQALHDFQLQPNHLKKDNPSFILAQKQMFMGKKGGVVRRQMRTGLLGMAVASHWAAWRSWTPLLDICPHIPWSLLILFIGCHLNWETDLDLLYKMCLVWVVPARNQCFRFVFELIGSLIVFSFPGLSQFDKSRILIWHFDQRGSIWRVWCSCLQSYAQSPLKAANNSYAFKSCLSWDHMERAMCVYGNILSFAFV